MLNFRRPRLVTTVVALAASLAAGALAAGVPAAPASAAAASPASQLKLNITGSPLSGFAAGSLITFRFTATNTGSSPFTFPTGATLMAEYAGQYEEGDGPAWSGGCAAMGFGDYGSYIVLDGGFALPATLAPQKTLSCTMTYHATAHDVANGGVWTQFYYEPDGRTWAPGWMFGTLTRAAVDPMVAVSGTPAIGSTLTSHLGYWGQWTTPHYQWRRGGTPIPGATAATYRVTAADAGSALSLAVTGVSPTQGSDITVSSAATAVVPPASARLAGADRYGTAIAVSRSSFPATAPVVVVANGANYPDALSAAPAAVKLGGPLLLTAPASLPAAVAAEIRRLAPKKIVIVGGEGAVSPTVAAALAHLAPSVQRIAGADRFATSLAVARAVFGAKVPAVFLATGLAFPDALSASGYAGAQGMPVVLVNGTQSSAPAALTQWLKASGTTTIDVAGGAGAVSSGVLGSIQQATGRAPHRFTGSDRYATNQAINAQYAHAAAGFLATGANFPDALAGAAAAGKAGAPLVLSPGTCVPKPALSSLRAWKTSSLTALGGPGPLSPAALALAACP